MFTTNKEHNMFFLYDELDDVPSHTVYADDFRQAVRLLDVCYDIRASEIIECAHRLWDVVTDEGDVYQLAEVVRH